MAGVRGQTTDDPVERFKPTSGTFPGVLGLVLVAVALAYVVVAEQTVTGLRIGSAMVLLGILTWITQLRPRATAYADTLVLCNMLRDTVIPMRMIDEVAVRQTLNVRVGDQRYSCIGIGRTIRSLAGLQRPRTARGIGSGKAGGMAGGVEVPHPEQSAMQYHDFVETRLRDLVAYARKAPVTDREPRVRRTWAVPELAVLAGGAAVFVISLFL